MFNPLDYLENWWHNTSQSLKTWISGDKEETLQEENLTKLPPEILQHLTKVVKDLPTPPAQQEALQTALEEALEKWQEHPDNAANSLVVLTTPVESLSLLFRESLQKWQAQHPTPLKFLPWTKRPYDFGQIPEKLRSALLVRGAQSHLSQETATTEEGKGEVVIIPNLSWCFLRGVEGLDGIDYLRDIVLKDRSRFWLIGAHHISWQYLDYVDKIGAYFEQTFALPDLTEEDLQTWLAPVITEAEIGFSSNLEKEDNETAQQRYFRRLTTRSRGISSVATQLFLNSLSYEVINPDSEEEQKKIKGENPYLPDLPNLSHNQHYLLFSLLLHGAITLPHLAYSLGDDENLVQHLVQVLSRSGVIKRQGALFKVDPVHYPRLRDDLDGNNFLI